MKKVNLKQKNVHNNLKISSFFNKIPNNVVLESSQKDFLCKTEVDIEVIPATPIISDKKQRNGILDTITNTEKKSKRKKPNFGKKHECSVRSPPKKKFNAEMKNENFTTLSNSSMLCTDVPYENSDLESHISAVKNITPKKSQQHSSNILEITSSQCCYSTPSKTPTKTKSPGKLFDRSLTANDFNVEVIENFVKITPSKSSEKIKQVSPIKKSPKKQTSILIYVSPSKSSRQAQSDNETTPVKNNKVPFPTSNSKAKMNLNLKFASTSTDFVANIAVQENNLLQELNKTTEDMRHLLEFDNSWENCEIEQYLLDLSTSQHCKVSEYIKKKSEVVITIESTKNKGKAKCILEGFWMWSKLNIGCTIYITAIKDNDTWKVTNDHGLIVYEPDVLISNTAVVGALFCKRRSVFKEKFMGFEPENKTMIIGVLVHMLLQNVLKSRTANLQKIEYILNDILSAHNIIKLMYNSSLTLSDIKNELQQFIPRIVKFMKDYVLENKNLIRTDGNWSGTIDTVQDIEENIWCPELGIKGKIDVSISSGNNIMPVELKTGRATVSLEHRGQVLLYILMMSKLGYNVSSGLLLYLREGILREVPYSDKEKRDLILLRNELTYYLTRKVEVNKDSEKFNENGLLSSNQTSSALKFPELPEPINHHSGCEKCPYSAICCSYLKYENVDITDNKVLNSIKEHVTAHLSSLHIQYFIHFSNLLDLEASEKTEKNVSIIYTKTPEEREIMGKCITYLRVTKNIIERDNLYEHTFEKIDNKNTISFLTSCIGESNYVVVSTSQRPAIASGLVSLIDHRIITVVLDRDLSLKYQNDVFHIDTYDSNSIFSFNFTNIAIMLESTKEAERLRRLIIDREPPTFKSKLPKIVASKAPPILKKLNRPQQRAVIKALSANDYLLIKGMPGAGKTATIVALIELLVALGNSVLLTSQTHSAVDNVCIRLKNCGVNVLRLGSQGRIHPDIQSMSEYELTKDCKSPEELEQVYANAKVLAVTCFGTKHPIFNKRTMDVCIVDESTQIIQCTLFRALYVSKKFVLIGDPYQLSPIVRNKHAISYGLSESLFERLQNPDATVTLNLNYRMNKTITTLANLFTYNGELQIANDSVGNAVLSIPNLHSFLQEYKEQQWVTETLNQSLEGAIKILDTGPVWHRWTENTKYNEFFNKCEIAVVVILIKALLKNGVTSNSIGVISPYTAQVAQLSSFLQGQNVEINTIDQFQGRDKEIIIFSCTLSRNLENSFTASKFHILEDRKRLNVAITRAKQKFIMIGDLETIKKYTPFGQLLQHIPTHCFIRLKDGEKGFNWDMVNQLHL